MARSVTSARLDQAGILVHGIPRVVTMGHVYPVFSRKAKSGPTRRTICNLSAGLPSKARHSTRKESLTDAHPIQP